MLGKEFSPWPSYSEEEIQAVERVLRSNKVNYWTGSEGREFEKEFARFCEVDHAIAVANGTNALEVAFRGLGIGHGDEVLVTPRTFVASASTISLCGAKPVFVDVDLNSQNINVDLLEGHITDNTKAILAVHLGGWPCEMDQISEIAKAHDLFVIEDCAQAHGARYKGKPVGSLGDVAAWSFCQDKIMTTGGEGGMVTTNRRDLWERMWAYKDHGKSYHAVYHQEHPPGYKWFHNSIGSNFRMTEMQSAIGRIQLSYIQEWHTKRLKNYRLLESVCLDAPGLFTPVVPEYVDHASYRFYAFVLPERLKPGWDRDKVVHEINQNGGLCMQGTCSEIYLEQAFEGSGLQPNLRLENARLLGETSLAFLVHPTLQADEIMRIGEAVCKVMNWATV